MDEAQSRLPSEARIRQIALNRLRAMGVQAYVNAKGPAGRLLIDPSRFELLPGMTLDPVQPFVVQGHDQLHFVAPSPLRGLGWVRFIDVETSDALHGYVAALWSDLLARLRATCQRAKTFLPSFEISPERLTIEASLVHDRMAVTLRFRGATNCIDVLSIDGKLLPELAPDLDGRVPIPEETVLFDVRLLDPILRAATIAREEQELDQGPVVLSLPPVPADSLGISLVELPTGEISPDRSSFEPLDLPDSSAEPEPPIWSLDLPEVADTADLFSLEDALPSLPPEEPEPEVEPVRRRPRIATDLPAMLRFGDRDVPVRVANVNAGGIFARLPLDEAPQAGAPLVVWGAGPLKVPAVVSFRRAADEAELFGTGEGIGIAFETQEAPLAGLQDRPSALVLAGGDGRVFALEAFARAGWLAWSAEDLLSAAVWVHSTRLRCAILDPGFEACRWTEALTSLDLENRGVRVILVDRGPGEPEAPAGVRRVAAEDLGRAVELLVSNPVLGDSLDLE